jgi:hypothetical protein
MPIRRVGELIEEHSVVGWNRNAHPSTKGDVRHDPIRSHAINESSSSTRGDVCALLGRMRPTVKQNRSNCVVYLPGSIGERGGGAGNHAVSLVGTEVQIEGRRNFHGKGMGGVHCPAGFAFAPVTANDRGETRDMQMHAAQACGLPPVSPIL